jgi:predicted amidohydrolase
MRLAAFQMEAVAGDVATNLAMISDAAAEAKAKSAEVMVAPELAVTGYGAGDAIRELAQPVDGAQVAALAEVAAKNSITLVAGFAERAGSAIYNSAALIEPNGRRVFYRKCQLYGAYEKAIFAPGDRAPAVFDLNVMKTGGMKAGLLICFDVEFPEYTRRLALAGAEIALVPTAQPDNESAPFIAEKIVPVRAFENGIAIVYADHAGKDERFAYAGRSCIVMPDGSDAARAGPTGAAVIVADYEPAAYDKDRAENPYLIDRRADLV